MIGTSLPEYIFIRTAIAALELIAPLSVLAVLLIITDDFTKWTPLLACLLVYPCLEIVFLTCVYLPRRHRLQKVAHHPILSRDQRRALFARCAAHIDHDYPFGWFLCTRSHSSAGTTRCQPWRENVHEWLLWALFSTPMTPGWEATYGDEMREYVAAVEARLGSLEEGYNPDVQCMRLTFDPVQTVHRPLVWYFIVGIVDAVTYARLYWHGFRHYCDKRWFQSFPPRPLTLFSRASNMDGLSYWYRPHRSLEEHPVLFLHGIGIGLFPYTAFLADLAANHPTSGILVPEYLFISARITSPPHPRPTIVRALEQLIDTHALPRIVVVAHSYGTTLVTQLLHTPTLAPRITATLCVDPIPFLLHLPHVAFHFVYRTPRRANEWLLWYFSSRDPDVARTLGRHFFWTENVLWKEELEGKEVAVVLSERDQVVNAPAVWRYLTGEEAQKEYWCQRGRGGQLEVLWFPELDHAMVFDKRVRWQRLMRVLDRFVSVLN